MILRNLSKNTIVSDDCEIAASFIARLLGLINPKAPRSLVFNTRFGIHTLFLSQPIDVLILDDNWRVKKIKEGLKPWRLFFWNPINPRVIELPEGEVKKSKINLGNQFQLS